MENSIVFYCFLFITTTLYVFYMMTKKKKENKCSLPPGPLALPLVGNLLWFTTSFFELEPTLRRLVTSLGPIIALRMGTIHAIFISGRDLAHEALVQNSLVLADRPQALGTESVISRNEHSITSSTYGPLWRLLRRNLTSEVLHPARLPAFSDGRRWAAQAMAEDLAQGVLPREAFHHALFGLMLYMCFGEKLGKETEREVEARLRALLTVTTRGTVFSFLPKMARILLWRKWNEFLEIHRRMDEILFPLIDDSRSRKRKQGGKGNTNNFLPYMDSLLDLKDPLEDREFNNGELATMCTELLIGGTDTTATGLEWIMANLVKHQHIQDKLRDEVDKFLNRDEYSYSYITEDHLKHMPYLRAVVMEGLRRHPPAHFVVPHLAKERMVLGGYEVPKGAMVNFMLAEMCWDESVWDEPMEFRPERFLPGGEGEGVDVTGTREIKMIPFGAGRRICPGINLAVFHLQFFVAFLVREFQWKQVGEEDVDLSEKQSFTVMMKHPLNPRIVKRSI